MHIRKTRFITGAMLAVLGAGLVSATVPSASAAEGFTLEVVPEFQAAPADSQVLVLTARLDQLVVGMPVRVNFEWVSGPFDFDRGDPREYETWDVSCVIWPGLDRCVVSIAHSGRLTPETSGLMLGYIDKDVNVATNEADVQEGRYAGPTDCGSDDPAGACSGVAVPGQEPEPDWTDVVQMGGSLSGDAGNRPPVATDDVAEAAKNTTVDVPVLANDRDPDGDPLSIEAVSAPSNGSVSVNPDQSIRYTPRRGFKGQDAFAYTVGDGRGGTDTASVVVSVGGRN